MIAALTSGVMRCQLATSSWESDGTPLELLVCSDSAFRLGEWSLVESGPNDALARAHPQRVNGGRVAVERSGKLVRSLGSSLLLNVALSDLELPSGRELPPIARPIGVGRARERIIERAVVVRPEHELAARVSGYPQRAAQLRVSAHPNISRRAVTHVPPPAPFVRVTDVCRPAKSAINGSVGHWRGQSRKGRLTQ